MAGHRNREANRAAWATDPRNANAVVAGIARQPEPAEQETGGGGVDNAFVIPLPSARARVRGTRRAMRGEMRHLAHADALALLDPDLPVSVRDRIAAATLALKLTGDLRDRVDVSLTHVVVMPTLLDRVAVDVEAQARLSHALPPVAAPAGASPTPHTAGATGTPGGPAEGA